MIGIMEILAAEHRQVPKPDPASDGPEKEDRVTVLNLKGTREYRDWLDRLSDFCHMPSSTLSDVALADHAKRVGFSEPPPKRLNR